MLGERLPEDEMRMVKFKLLINKFRILVLLLVSVLLLISLVPNVSIAQEDYKVIFDETRPIKREGMILETAWYGGSNFANALRSNGFSVSRISDKPLTHEKLQGYDVLIILSSRRDYSSSEIECIKDFVETGGGLFLTVDSWSGHEEFATNRIAKSFGVSFERDTTICDPTDFYSKDKKDIIRISDIKSHAITKNVSSFYFVKGTDIIVTGASNVLAYTDSDAWLDNAWGGIRNMKKDSDEITGSFPVLSEMTYGKGRIVFIGDRGLFINAWLDHLDNGQLGLNIVNWLANRPTTSIYTKSERMMVVPDEVGIEYRIAGIIVVALLLFIGLIFKIRKDKRQEKPKAIKLIEKWKVTMLTFAHIGAGLLSFFYSIAGGLASFGHNRPCQGYVFLLIFVPFCLITAMILYNLISYKKLYRKYIFILNILCALFILFCLFFWDIPEFGNFSSINDALGDGIIIMIPLSIPNIASLLIIRNYGTELIIKGKEVKGLPKRLPKTFPAELEHYYHEAEYIGEGGFAWIFSATRKDGEKVAIKIPKSSDEKTGKLFIREVSNWSTLEHENIAKLYDFNIFPIPYLEMELCDGSLGFGRRDLKEAISIIYEVAKGLKYAHEKKIVHADIKHANILIKDGKIKISDWGLSKVKRSESISVSALTPKFAAPEQILGRIDERTDIWQLGVVFYELVTGKLPFEGEDTDVINHVINDEPVPPSEINPDSKCVEHIIMKCLSKRKEERYQSIDELLGELENYKPEGETTLSNEKKGGRETVEFNK